MFKIITLLFLQITSDSTSEYEGNAQLVFNRITLSQKGGSSTFNCGYDVGIYICCSNCTTTQITRNTHTILKLINT